MTHLGIRRTQPVAAGYMANALRMKHENYDELRRILDIVGQTVKVHARGYPARSGSRVSRRLRGYLATARAIAGSKRRCRPISGAVFHWW